MGIPHLLRLLEPFAEPVDLVHAGADLAQQRTAVVVVDGPALAYHAYHTALSRRMPAEHALEAIPPYSEVCATAVTWLETLQHHALLTLFARAAIYFDGALPDYKKPIRVERINTYLTQLARFRTLHHNGVKRCRVLHAPLLADQAELFAVRHVPAKLNDLSAAPFLVSAVMEALHASTFTSAVRLVPGEADEYCASHAQQHPGTTVVTSDSDLLVYDLGPHGAVMLFRDFTMAGKILKARRYDPSAISRRLRVQNLLKLAFIIKGNKKGKSLTQCVELANNLQGENKDLSQFTEEYRVNDSVADFILSLQSSPLPGQDFLLDPRVSEYVLKHRKGLSARTMYLGFLIEDPQRSSAWKCGEAPRTLGYSLVGGNAYRSTFEIQRRGAYRMAEIPISHFESGKAATTVTKFTQDLDNWRTALGSQSDVWFWISFAVIRVCEFLVADGKDLPSKPAMRDLLTGRWVGKDWAKIHFSAQVQAELYSWRMLSQFIQVWQLQSRNAKEEDATGLCKTVPCLESHLNTLPGVRDLFFYGSQDISAATTKATAAIADKLFDTLGIDEKSHVASKQKKKKNRIANDTHTIVKPDVTSTNMFDLLRFEDE